MHLRNLLIRLAFLALLAPLPAAAQLDDGDTIVIDNYRYSGCSDTGGTPISVTGVVFDLSATTCASYQTGQTWSNLTTSPADSNTKATYDLYLGDTSGATATDPTFTGTAGSTASYWAFDGGDYFTLKSGAGGPAFIVDLHREDQTNLTSFVIAFHFKHNGSAVQNLFGNTSSSSTAHAGFRLGVNTSDVLQLLRNTGDAANTNNTKTTGITLTDDTDYIVAFTLNSSTLAYKASKNGASFSDTGSCTTLTSLTNSHSAVDLFTIGATNKNTATAVISGTKVYQASMYNVILSDANLATIAAAYEARTGLDFTP